MEKYYLKQALLCVKNNDLEELKEVYNDVIEYNKTKEYNIPHQNIFKRTFLSACIKDKRNIILWLFELYKTFEILDKTGLKPTFYYAKYICKNKGWFEKNIMKYIRTMAF